jgi:hypothetical protein
MGSTSTKRPVSELAISDLRSGGERLVSQPDFCVLSATKKLVPVALNLAQMICGGDATRIDPQGPNSGRHSAHCSPRKRAESIRVGCYASEEFLSSLWLASKQISPATGLNQPLIRLR